MALDKFINNVRTEVAKRFDLKTDAEIDAFFIGMEESAKDNQEAIEKRDKMLRDTVEELGKAKRFLKVAVKDFRILGTMLEDGRGHCTAKIGCDECVLGGGNLADDCQWRYAAEALVLIGKDIDVPATEDDTNVGRKKED